MVKRYIIKVSGKVQGVGFRFSSYLKFDELHLTGKADNMTDGSVQIEAQGEEAALEQFVEWAKRGPEGARIRGMTVNREAPVEPAADDHRA